MSRRVERIGTQILETELDLIKSRLRGPFGVVQESFGDRNRGPSAKTKEIFHDWTDGLLRVANKDEGLGNAITMER
jgi:hypothetical protein